MSERRHLSIVLALTTATALSLAACASSSTATPAAGGGSSSSSATPAAGGGPSSSAVPSAAGSSSGLASASSSASSSQVGPAAGAGIAGCDAATLATKKAGVLTVATDDPAYEPWFSDNTPANGKGFESAVAYAVAGRLGFDKSKVSWVKQSFNAATSPAPKNFDFDVNEFTVTATRAKAVDFSTGYYDVTQAVVTVKGPRSPARSRSPS